MWGQRKSPRLGGSLNPGRSGPSAALSPMVTVEPGTTFGGGLGAVGAVPATFTTTSIIDHAQGAP